MILITGATGFIGSEVCARMVKKHGAENVYLLQRRVPDDENSVLAKRFQEHGLSLKEHCPHIIKVDLTDFATLSEKLKALSEQFDQWTLFHLAAMIDKKKLNRQEQKKINVDLSLLLVRWANQSARRFIYTSSVAAFGLSVSPKLRDEDNYWSFHWISNLFPYYRTKRLAHDLVLENLSIPYSVFCPSVVHGSLEFAKESRAHIQGVIEKNMRVMPPGGANFVSLDQVASSLEAASEDFSKDSYVRLSVGENWSLVQYVNEWKFVAGREKIEPILLPRFIFWIVLLIYLPFVYFMRIKKLEGVLATFSYFYFQSKFETSPTKCTREAIKDAYATSQFG